MPRKLQPKSIRAQRNAAFQHICQTLAKEYPYLCDTTVGVIASVILWGQEHEISEEKTTEISNMILEGFMATREGVAARGLLN